MSSCSGHYFYDVGGCCDDEKVDELIEILDSIDICPIIFCNTIDTVEWLEEILAENYSTVMFHGNMSYRERMEAMKMYDHEASMVITTNIMAKNCKCCDLVCSPIVINFDLPENPEIYRHRASRTCTFTSQNNNTPKSGIVINFYDSWEDGHLRGLENHYDVKLLECPSLDFLAEMF